LFAFAHCRQIALLNEHWDEIVVNEEEIHLMSKFGVFNMQTLIAMIQHPMSSIKVADHYTFVFCYRFQEASVQLMILPHLKNVDDLP